MQAVGQNGRTRRLKRVSRPLVANSNYKPTGFAACPLLSLTCRSIQSYESTSAFAVVSSVWAEKASASYE